MRYALTGDSGMLASVLKEELRAAGFTRVSPPAQEIRRWVSPSSGREEPDFREERFVKWLDGADWDVLFHAGALVGTTRCEEHVRNVWSCNVAAAHTLADVVARRGRQLVFFASDSEFDPADYGRDKPIRVSGTEANPHSRYGMSKLAARLLVEGTVPPPDLLVVYPCFGFGGALDGNSCVAELLKCAAGIYDRRPFLPLDPAALKEVTSHAHIGRAVVAAFRAGVRGRIPAASGSPLPYGDVVDVVRAVTGRDLDPEWREELDYKMDLLYDPGEVAEVNALLLGGDPLEDLEAEVRREWDALRASGGRDLAEHEWKHTEALRRRVER